MRMGENLNLAELYFEKKLRLNEIKIFLFRVYLNSFDAVCTFQPVDEWSLSRRLIGRKITSVIHPTELRVKVDVYSFR